MTTTTAPRSPGLRLVPAREDRTTYVTVVHHRRLATTETSTLRGRFLEKERTQLHEADLIREFLLHGRMLSRADASRVGGSEAHATRRSSR